MAREQDRMPFLDADAPSPDPGSLPAAQGGGPATDGAGVVFQFNGIDFLYDDRHYLNLTLMWKAAGSPENQDPRQWRRKEGKGFIDDTARSLNVAPGHIIVGERGRGGSTWGHWQISVAYAKYLSHEFHRVVNEAWREHVQEQIDPALKVDRAIKRARKLGWSDARIKARFDGIINRNFFTEKLQAHEVRSKGFAICTDAVYRKVIGTTAQGFRAEKGLKKNDRTRDHMDVPTLSAISYAESLSGELLDKHDARGNDQAKSVCERAGDAVARMRKALGLG